MVFKLRPRNLIFKIAKSTDRIGMFNNLINNIYREEGYIQKDMFPDRYSEFSTIFYAMKKETGKIVAGLRSVKDVIGLPLDEVFDVSNLKSEIMSRGGTYVECGARFTKPKNSPNASFGLVAMVYQYLVREKISDTLIAIHEVDKPFYENLGFRAIERKYYKKVHRYAFLMHAETEKWCQSYKDCLLQSRDNIIFD